MTSNGMYKLDVDFVPRTMPEATNLGRLVILEDNDAVIKMLIKGRTDRLRHVPRTHRIDLDWLFEIIKNDPGINIKYISTKRNNTKHTNRRLGKKIGWCRGP